MSTPFYNNPLDNGVDPYDIESTLSIYLIVFQYTELGCHTLNDELELGKYLKTRLCAMTTDYDAAVICIQAEYDTILEECNIDRGYFIIYSASFTHNSISDLEESHRFVVVNSELYSKDTPD